MYVNEISTLASIRLAGLLSSGVSTLNYFCHLVLTIAFN